MTELVISPCQSENSISAEPIFDLERTWCNGLESFIASRRSVNTQRVYTYALKDFFAHTCVTPWAVTNADVQAYVEYLHSRKTSQETINARVAAISSFYRFMQTDYQVYIASNPASAQSLRDKITPYSKSNCLSAEESRALLNAIDRDSTQGIRDFALFFTYLATGRKNTEIRLLCWGDIQSHGDHIYYKWISTNNVQRVSELPLFVWKLILDWLKVSGRLPKMESNSYIFTAISTNGVRFPCVRNRKRPDGQPLPYDPTNEPLSIAQISSLLKKYAKRAGLRPEKINVCTLRNSAAMLRKEGGDDIDAIRELLGHSYISTTRLYLRHIEDKAGKSWSNVQAILGY